jgi:hypothetical protein
MENVLNELKKLLENQKVNNVKFGNGVIVEVVSADQNVKTNGRFGTVSRVKFDEVGEKNIDVVFALENNVMTLLNDEDDVIKSEVLGIVMGLNNIEKEKRHKEYLELFEDKKK